MGSSAPPFLVSADPGSSGKGWAVASCDAGAEALVDFKVWRGPDLLKLVDQLCDRALESPVLLAIDAPIRAFGGLQAPRDLDPQPGRFIDHKDKLLWPFDVNPFSQRPCERALSSVPPVHLRKEAHRALAEAIDSLIGNKPKQAKDQRKSFVKTHQGISVLGYMGAPHAPVVRTFLNALGEIAKGKVEISYDADAAESEWRTPGRITILESHPAVAMGFYCRYRVDDGTFPDCVSKYKGAEKSVEALKQLSDIAGSHLRTRCSGPNWKIESDDHLDALFGLLLLLEIADGRGDLFGTAQDGYFLIPRSPDSDPQKESFRSLWEAADAESRSALS